MVFSSILFIFRFLPLALGIYYLTPKKYKNFILLILSLNLFLGRSKIFRNNDFINNSRLFCE